MVLALVISTVFVLLSQWQFSSAQESAPPSPSSTEEVQPLTEVFEPGVPMLADMADQMVSMTGRYLEQKQVLVQNRLQDGEAGYWVVSAFEVDDAPALEGAGGGENPVIPVARGWVPEAADAPPAPAGELTVTGRLIPTEAPIAQRPVEGQVPSLAVAELINRWDVASYAGFVVADSAVAAGGGAVDGPVELEEINIGPQPQAAPVNWLNIFYAAEWVVFAGFAIFLWWRLVADDYRRTLEDDEDSAYLPNDGGGSGRDTGHGGGNSGRTEKTSVPNEEVMK